MLLPPWAAAKSTAAAAIAAVQFFSSQKSISYDCQSRQCLVASTCHFPRRSHTLSASDPFRTSRRERRRVEEGGDLDSFHSKCLLFPPTPFLFSNSGRPCPLPALLPSFPPPCSCALSRALDCTAAADVRGLHVLRPAAAAAAAARLHPTAGSRSSRRRRGGGRRRVSSPSRRPPSRRPRRPRVDAV